MRKKCTHNTNKEADRPRAGSTSGRCCRWTWRKSNTKNYGVCSGHTFLTSHTGTVQTNNPPAVSHVVARGSISLSRATVVPGVVGSWSRRWGGAHKGFTQRSAKSAFSGARQAFERHDATCERYINFTSHTNTKPQRTHSSKKNHSSSHAKRSNLSSRRHQGCR